LVIGIRLKQRPLNSADIQQDHAIVHFFAVLAGVEDIHVLSRLIVSGIGGFVGMDAVVLGLLDDCGGARLYKWVDSAAQELAVDACEDAELEGVVTRVVEQFGLPFASVVRLVHQGRILGCVGFARRSPEPLTPEQSFLFGSLQTLIALVLANRGTVVELRESHGKITRILESITDAFFSLDRQWRITYLNSEAERLLRKPKAQLLGKDLWQEFPHADAFRRQYEEVLATNKAAHFDETYEPLGTVFEVHAYPSSDCLNVYFRDVTERKRAEQALMKAEKLASAGRIAATIAHEINNPLAGAINTLYLLAQETSLSEEAREWVKMAEQELKRAAQIARRTLGFYREPNARTAVRVSQIFEELAAVYQPRLNDRGLRIEMRYADPSACVRGNIGELRQLISNLLVNSIDAVGDHGTVYLRVGKPSVVSGTPAVRITVADNGAGIQPENMKRIFEAFFTTKQDVGTGLGLWISDQIVKKHGGTMRVRSQPGKGTVVSVVIPAAQPTDAAQARSAAAR
jgi:PAS domain S-box-containing protein